MSKPLLELDHVYKRFGAHLAVNDLSFSLHAGEIVGLLGPNGAGKTTTMRLIASYFFPDVGKIYLNGQATTKRTLLTQAEIGYLPENNPLYNDMLVIDFLLLTWGLTIGARSSSGRSTSPSAVTTRSSTSSSRLEQIYRLAQSVNLAKKLTTPIGQLSKGYKQRVGLAAALLPNPKVLILDEPTEGLDPNERQEIRALIKKLATDRVILISTHVLQEVKALCTKAIVINDGKLVVAGDPQHLSKQFTLELQIEGAKVEAELKKLLKPKAGDKMTITTQVTPVAPTTSTSLSTPKTKIKTITLTAARDLRPEIAKLAATHQWVIWNMTAADELDQVFRNLKS